MPENAFFALNPVRWCYDRALTAEAFSGSQTGTDIHTGEEVEFYYDAPFAARYDANDEELDELS